MPSEPANRLNLALTTAALLSQVGREHSTALDRRFAGFGLTTQQAALLLHASREPVSPSKLTEVLGTDTAGMTRLLDRLEVKDLIRRQRTATDRRAVLIEVTDEGRALLPRLPVVFGLVNRQLFADFDDNELEQLLTLCQRMRTNLHKASIDS
ncbi:MarR family transcriptional regulator [Amycolatopsis mediterranei]|uniref:MarR family winged helix-turn-helix transcriptional regulator n=1 Tax=Amycolatopsis mediterranei TaxID=33910 RepID=UPI00343ECAFB